MERSDLEFSAADARHKQIIADVLHGIRSDIPAFTHLARKVNRAADTRAGCKDVRFNDEEYYRLIRLANVGVSLMLARILERSI